ncbi:MAG TPA: Ig-like domain-containing domain [Bacteroidia bacterium]|jgi:uncharacterized protein (DUF2141 family)|nr:Ig-like domain-containing domain [Bacteroidia bacterium]
MKFYSHYSFLFILCIFICSCAQISAPTGGALDKTPPKVLHYYPDSAALNFNSKSIEIVFNEFVELRELNSQLIISPPLEYTPEITTKKKTLSIVFDKREVLKPNSTYSISFGKAIVDNHEGTPLENFRYIFSTGSFIDSLSLSGSVQYAFNHKAEKNILVMLYADLTDSAIYKRIPDYFAKTTEVGSFTITNIRPGKYRVVAVKDDNNNYKYNEGEVIGFLDSLVEAGKSEALSIPLFQEEAKKVFLKKNSQINYGKFVFIFNKGTDSLHLNILNKDQFIGVKQLVEYSKMKDSITLWMDHIDKDSLVIQSVNGSSILDTVRFNKLMKKETATKNTSRGGFKLTPVNPLSGEVDLNNPLVLLFSHPIEKINDSTPILLKQDTLSYKKLPLAYKKLDSLRSAIILTTNQKPAKNTGTTKSTKNPILKENAAYDLLIPSGTFTDFFGLKNDTIRFKWRTREEKYYGTVELKLKFENIPGNLIVQLLDDKENIIRQNIISQPETIFYDYLNPMVYKLKVIFDKNKNGKWDVGNYLEKKQPEQVIYNVEAVNIRSNWDQDLEWTITEPK